MSDHEEVKNKLNQMEFVLGEENNHIYLGHFMTNEKGKEVFVPDSDDMTNACISIVAHMMNKQCEKDKTDTSMVFIKDMGVLQFGNKRFLSYGGKSDEKHESKGSSK